MVVAAAISNAASETSADKIPEPQQEQPPSTATVRLQWRHRQCISHHKNGATQKVIGVSVSLPEAERRQNAEEAMVKQRVQ